MPKATVNKNHLAKAREHQIRSSRKSSDIQAVTVPKSVAILLTASSGVVSRERTAAIFLERPTVLR